MANKNVGIHAAKGGKARWMPRATHQGILKIMDKELPCVVLEDGRRLITETAVLRAFNKRSRGSKKDVPYPVFLEAKNLIPFFTEETTSAIKKVNYMDTKGKEYSGFSAEIIPIVCDVYLSARNSGKLIANQCATAEISELLVRSLSKVGIVALIDEATGYQQIRPKDALEAYLNKVLGKELTAWCKKFPDEYYENIYKLKGWPEFSTSKNKYSCVGNYTNDIIYSRLGQDVLDELKTRTPDTSKVKMHQWLSVDTGHSLLSNHMVAILALQKFAISEGWGWNKFVTMVNQTFPKRETALTIEN